MRLPHAISASILAITLGITAATGPFAQERDEPARLSGPESRGAVAYALMNGSDSIAVIDLDNRRIAGRIAAEGNPHGGAITPDGRYIYTASMGSDKINVIDARSGKTVKTIELGGISHHSAATPDGRYVYVAAEQVVVIDTASNEVVTRIATREPPFDLVFAPDGRLIYALGIGSTISVIDTRTNRVVDTISMTRRSIMGHLALRPDGKELFVTNDADDAVTVIDTERNEPVAVIPVGKGPHGIATSADGRHVVVTNRGGTTISVIDIDRREVVAVREVGRRPEHISLTPDRRFLLISINTGANKILMVDPASFETRAEIEVWPSPHAFVFPRSASGGQRRTHDARSTQTGL